MNKIQHILKLFTLFALLSFSQTSFSQWQSINSGVTENLVDGCFVSDSIGFIIGSNGALLKTIDAGDSWSMATSLNGSFTSISFVDQDTIYVGGDKLYRSDDGGNTWNLLQSFNYTISDLTFFDGKIGLMIVPSLDTCYRGYYSITQNYRVYRSEDSGTSWQYLFNEAINASRFELIDKQSAIVPRTEHTIFHGCGGPVFNSSLRTDDKGKTWYYIFGEAYGNYSFVNSNVGYSISSHYNSHIYFTRNGKNAMTFETNIDKGIKKCLFMNEIDGYAIGINKIQFTKSKGIIWRNEYNSSKSLNYLFKNLHGTLICVGDSGFVLKKPHINSTTAEAVYRLTINRNSLDFGQVNIDSTSTKSISIVNTGTTPLDLSLSSSKNFKLSFSNSSFSKDVSLRLNSFRDTLLYVKFFPDKSSAFNDTILISEDSLSDIIIPLMGIGFSGLSDTIFKDTLICVDTLTISGDVVIPDSVTVKICAGTYIEIMGEFDIKVYGVLQMLGDSLNEIRLQTFGPYTNWDGIKINSSNDKDTSKFNYCNFTIRSTSPIISLSSGKAHINHSYLKNTYNWVYKFAAIESKGSGKLTVSNSSILDNWGHAIWCDLPDSTFIINNIIRGTRYGAAIKVNSSHEVYISRNEIHNNDGAIDGSGPMVISQNKIYNNDSEAIKGNGTLHINRNLIHSNEGGININSTSKKIVIQNNTIYDNRSSRTGGITVVDSCELYLNQNLIFNNEARSFDGGGLLLNIRDNLPKFITNNTICNNKVRPSYRGNNIFFWAPQDSTIDLNVLNNIIYSSNNFDKSVIWYNIEGQNIEYNCINQSDFNQLGNTNIISVPNFVYPTTVSNFTNYDWSLDSTSSCINAGHPNDTSFLLPLDILGNPRINNFRVDIGAIEFFKDTTIGIREWDHYNLQLFPNPVEDEVNITLDYSAQVEMTIYDAASRPILRTTFRKKVKLDLSEFKKGLYLYKIENKERVLTRGKLIKQ